MEWAESAALKGLQGPQVSAVMEARQLIVWGVVAACLSLSNARVLNVVVPTFWDGDVKKPALMADVAVGAASPERDHSRQPARNTGNPQGNRIRPAAGKLPRKLPEGLVDLLEKVPHLVQRQTVKTDRLAVRCGSSKIQVEVKQDLMGTGKLVKPEELTLGGCSPTEVDDWAHVLAFESELHSCGSTLEMRENTFVYAFKLIYNPRKADRTPIIRSQSAVISLECHYLR
ncbi:uncharacterized protein LOC130535167 [Takifugu flavidus]|uniref:Zona pellucida sperm-binding protein 3 n=1 Tax=Takifugu flavidus TaxID=433684 RepID=A0A5C6PHE0_9TELE|nr:uncharacterized protein LOC130535167 [Takifugu flavidus]TWW77807.1 Zona pellucida sperm-binding protein 3 [Takifugu flavidus]